MQLRTRGQQYRDDDAESSRQLRTLHREGTKQERADLGDFRRESRVLSASHLVAERDQHADDEAEGDHRDFTADEDAHGAQQGGQCECANAGCVLGSRRVRAALAFDADE